MLPCIGPSFPWGPIYKSKNPSLTTQGYADLTDVTLAGEDNRSQANISCLNL